MKKRHRLKITIRLGNYTTDHAFYVSDDVVKAFAESCNECDPSDVDDVLDHLAREVEDTVNAFIRRAYHPFQTRTKILEQAGILLAAELVMTEEILKNAEGGKMP
ncbi:MAG: hypothetical protein GXO29_05820 [Thermotogae bacterium]|nr:hypothetical protein [Thermotogota bacterium]